MCSRRVRCTLLHAWLQCMLDVSPQTLVLTNKAEEVHDACSQSRVHANIAQCARCMFTDNGADKLIQIRLMHVSSNQYMQTRHVVTDACTQSPIHANKATKMNDACSHSLEHANVAQRARCMLTNNGTCKQSRSENGQKYLTG